ncbi:MAG: TonB-dependent receptor [Methylovirgula sp.]|nr:TonB-dependent receptor [Methylovirgula sp.]
MPRAVAQEATAGGELPTVEVVATTPLGAGTSTLDVPSETQTLDSQQIETLNLNSITQDLARRTPGVSTTDALGSPVNQSLDFRGETASPLPGTPQGLAVYMNGVRINEAYGDVVNWGFIPTVAIDRAQIVTGNPVFGLNALAGAVVMNMKNGFTWQGTEFDLQGGSDYTVQGSGQYGIKKDNWAYYVAMEGVRTNGYRYFGQSDVERGYADVGYRAEGNEVHFSMNGAAIGTGATGTTPLELVQQNPWAAFNLPGQSDNQVAMITLSDQSQITSTLQFNGNAYFREYAASREDGNVSNFYHCAAAFVCNSNDLDTSVGPPYPNPVGPITGGAPGTTPLPDPTTGLPNGTPMGEIDRNWTHTYSTGTTLQLTDTDKILGHTNNFTAGISEDHGWTHFNGISELGSLPPSLVVSGFGEYINEPAYDVSPVDLLTQNNYLGVFVLDAFDVTDKLTLHAGARFNDAQINLNDQLGTSLTSSNNFSRINPVVGLSYKITPDIAVYGSYSEANRAPTPLELGCSSPTQPCMIDNFLVADPPLQQVVARTFEAGFKGSNAIAWAAAPGRLDWSVSAYRTENQNDIMSVPSPKVVGFGYFTNAGNTLRQGVDVGATYTTDKWDAYANYSYISATFLTPVLLSSPNNPYADANGNIQVEPGDHIPGIPQHKFKIGFDYTVLPKWTVGADLVYQSGQYYFGDEINALGQIPGYVTLNLRTSYQVNKDVQVFGLINNATDARYYTYGALYDTGSTANQVTGAPVPGLFYSNNPRSVTISAPLEAFVGVKVTM